MNAGKTPKPGDLLLEHYFPNADEETRKQVLAAFRDYAEFLIRLGERIEQDLQDNLTDTTEGATLDMAH